MKKERIAAIVMAASAVMMTGCGVVDKVDELLGFEDDPKATTTISIATTARNRETTTTRIYTVENEKEYTTTTERDDGFDPDELDRADVTTYERKKNGDIKLNTTTTTKKTNYDVLQMPAGDEYFEITKSYQTKEKTELKYGPSKQYNSQFGIKAGTPLLCMGQSGDWYYVCFDNTTYGWVNKSAVEDYTKKATTTKKKSS